MTATFEEQVLPHEDYLIRLAYRIVKNSNDARDAVQETFCKAWRDFDKFEQGTNLIGWLTTILKNTIASMFRRQRPGTFDHLLTGGEWDESIIWSSIPEDPADVVLLREEHSPVWSALAELPPLSQEILTAVASHGPQRGGVQAAADDLGISRVLASQRLMRARGQIKQLLEA